MKPTQLLLALAIALGTTAASAAPVQRSAATGADGAPAAVTAKEWSRAGERELQQENARTALDHQGFPQFNN